MVGVRPPPPQALAISRTPSSRSYSQCVPCALATSRHPAQVGPLEVDTPQVEPPQVRPLPVEPVAVEAVAVEPPLVLDEDLVELASALGVQYPAATRHLESLIGRGDPFDRRLLQAPLEEEELGKNGHRLLDEADRDIEAGRVLGLDDVKREFGL